MTTTPMIIAMNYQRNAASYLLSKITEISVLDPTREKATRVLKVTNLDHGENFKTEWNRVVTWINEKHGADSGVLWVGHRLYEESRDILKASWKRHGIYLPGNRFEMSDSHRVANCLRHSRDNDLKDYRCMLGLPQTHAGDTASEVDTLWRMLKRFATDRGMSKAELISTVATKKWASKIAAELRPVSENHIVVYDFETTGLPVDGVYPHIVQASAYMPYNPEASRWYDAYVKPPEDIEIHPKAVEVHKITKEMVKDKSGWGEEYPRFRRAITPAKLADKIVMVGYNSNGFQRKSNYTTSTGETFVEKSPGGFDVNVLMTECDRHGFDLRREFITGAEKIHFCAMKQFDVYGLMQSVFKGMFERGQRPQGFFKLTHMVEFFDLTFEGAAHNSRFDVLATWKLFERVMGKADRRVVSKTLERGSVAMRNVAFAANPELPAFIAGKIKLLTEPQIPRVIEVLSSSSSSSSAVPMTDDKGKGKEKSIDLGYEPLPEELLEEMDQETREALEILDIEKDPDWVLPSNKRDAPDSPAPTPRRSKRRRKVA